MTIAQDIESRSDRNFLRWNAINVLRFEVDKNQMLGVRQQVTTRIEAEGTLMQIFRLALELLNRCGMILKVRLRTLLEDGLVHHSLSSTVHYSLVIFCNDLNLSGGSYV
jgi:hypothetical protein